MRRQHYVRLTTVANLANHLDHSLTRRRIQPVRRLVEEDHLRPMHNRLRQLRQLLHAERERIQIAIARFTKTDKEQRFVRAFERGCWPQPRKLGHQAHEMYARHLGDERVALRHIADE